jgi:S-adenosylmethionine:tRNA ribosyltransferase-isomerase
MKTNYTLEDFTFDLPDELIAQHPAEKRDASRLMVLDRTGGSRRHLSFGDIVGEIRAGDVLVFNNARVIHARIYCLRRTGGRVEIILTRKKTDGRWLIICNRTKRLNIGEIISPEKDSSINLAITGRVEDHLEIESDIELTDDILKRIGEMPLPPYIRHAAEKNDSERYQTVYASESGAVAAPTAGLHFTPELLESLKNRGARLEFLTLYVSWGTFQPVRSGDISLHRMHTERYYLPEETAEAVNLARREGRRVIAVGTTSLRVLETTFIDGVNTAGTGETDIFIYPPAEVRSIDALVTNFHTPGSTLLMLVSAFAGYELIMDTYREAVRGKYRFFSYGDAMMIV